MKDWKLLKVVMDGEYLEIAGSNVWNCDWEASNIPPFEVPHPSYPSQRHKLSPYLIDAGGEKTLFAAGELSNCVWCFYVPA